MKVYLSVVVYTIDSVFGSRVPFTRFGCSSDYFANYVAEHPDFCYEVYNLPVLQEPEI